MNDAGSVEGLRSAIQHFLDTVCQPIQVAALAVTPSLSCGVAVFPTNGTQEKELLTKADAALYEAKKQGKNRFVFSE